MSINHPKKGEKVFISNLDNTMAYIPKSIDGSHDELLDRYYKGFRDLANAGVEYVISYSYSNSVKDSLVFPIIYNYRHFLELILKKYAIKYKRDQVDLDNLGHNLEFYWRLVKPLLLETYSNVADVKQVIEATEGYILEFHELDKSSMAFRYPFTKGESLAPFFDEDIRINIYNLKERMDELYNLLEYLEDSIDARGNL